MLLIIANFSFDLIGVYSSKKPLATGYIHEFSSQGNKHTVELELTKGKIHEGEFISSNEFIGSIAKINATKSSSGNIIVEIEGNTAPLTSAAFNVYSNLRMVNILLLIELIFIYTIFFLLFQAVPLWKKLTLTALIFSVVFWFYRNILLDLIHSYGGYYNGGTTILIILFALAFFYYQLKQPENPFIYSTPAFWIISAILLYKVGTFFLFLYSNTLDQNEKANFYIINSAFYILQNLLFTIAFLIDAKKKQVKHNPKRTSLQYI